MSDIKFSIVKQISILSNANNWNKELNYIKWGDNSPKFDIRRWDKNHNRMSKGIALTKEELLKISQSIKNNLTLLKNSNQGKKVEGDSYECEILHECEIITISNKSTLELNIIRWNSGEPCFDIRRWFDNRQKIGKGICLSSEESERLINCVENETLSETKQTEVEPISISEIERGIFI